MTDSYYGAKCTQAVRQFVFVRPSTFVVFDRVTATDPSFAKSWLMHSVDEPTIGADGRSFRIEAGPSALHTTVLMPANARVRAIGGPGKEFMSAGSNHPQAGRPRKAAGAWRVEVSPAQPRKTDHFLHVLRVTDSGVEPVGQVTRIRTPSRLGAKVDLGNGTTATVLFNANGPVGGHVSIEGPEKLNQPLTTKVQPQVGIAAQKP
jgi:heparin/heparan-sulfate lyase